MTPFGRIIGALLLAPLGTNGVQGQSRPTPLTPGEGRVAVPGGQIWYRVVGTGRGTPLVLVHGCCGAASYYLDPLADLGRDRPVVFYDQLGTGRSDLTTDTMVWAPERRVGELHLLLQSLGLTAFHLYGHSGGTRIALEYYLAHPEGVRSVIFGGPVFADSLLFRQMAALRATLPDSVQRALARYEREGRCDTPEYEAAIDVFRKRFHDRR
ncbi:MAG TPA: alpha/beta fold hydrolase, partial [Gemmatimonadales bacterium]|nr:alpha/beta fold hydrolase [Gemmatimonadales bacterium]